MNQNIETLEGKEVICMPPQGLIQHDTFKSEQFLKELQLILTNQSKNAIPPRLLSTWLSEGRECEMLSPNQDWRKGKLRIKLELEFIPDEVETEENIESQNHQFLNEFRQ